MMVLFFKFYFKINIKLHKLLIQFNYNVFNLYSFFDLSIIQCTIYTDKSIDHSKDNFSKAKMKVKKLKWFEMIIWTIDPKNEIGK
jgi:hypothetical protein